MLTLIQDPQSHLNMYAPLAFERPIGPETNRLTTSYRGMKEARTESMHGALFVFFVWPGILLQGLKLEDNPRWALGVVRVRKGC